MSDITPLYTVAKQVLANFFKLEEAENYYAHEIEDRDTGQRYIITMQKVDGETPLHQLAEANDRIEQLERQLAEMKQTPSAARIAEITEVAKAMREWIDAVPTEFALPVMPGFDRDWADKVIDGHFEVDEQ
jgi:hypothetical protein